MEKRKIKKPELLAPAGNWSMLNTAINNGADAVYFGVKNFNMRAAASNFDISELEKIAASCREKKIKTHLTLNSIVFEDELNELDLILHSAKQANIDLIICWDMSVIQKCREYKIPFCISTQASASNSSAVKFYEQLGAKRIVLARECTLDKIKDIRSKTEIEIETFIHGAMCIAVSGRCFMSHEIFGKSANRGECLQPCRREYEIKDIDEKFNLTLGEDYVLSPNDLCTLDFIDKLIEAGIDSFKIEGRKRAPEYVAKTVNAYRRAIDLYFENKLTRQIKNELIAELKKVYNRGFSPGFYFGEPGSESYAKIYGSIATTKKVYVGKVLNYYKKNKIAFIRAEAESLKSNDSIYIIGSTTGVIELTVGKMMKDELELDYIERGNDITLRCENLVRPNDKVYKIVNIDL
jgi:putative protease